MDYTDFFHSLLGIPLSEEEHIQDYGYFLVFNEKFDIRT